MSVSVLFAATLLSGASMPNALATDTGDITTRAMVNQESPVTVAKDEAAQLPLIEPAAAPLPTRPAAPAPTSGTDQTDQSDIIVTARLGHLPGDPFENVNARSFAVTQTVDEAVVGPVALAYERSVPRPIRSGLRNFLNNLHEPDVVLNFLIQLKPGKAAETFGRFALNSTIGGAGLFDVAKRRPFNLPRRPNGFADSLGYYGVKPGPFMYLPLIGPTTIRDFIGFGLDRLLLPSLIGKPFNQPIYTIPTGVLSSLDRRAEFDEQLNILRNGNSNPYAASREFYLTKRQAEIDCLRGRSCDDPAL